MKFKALNRRLFDFHEIHRLKIKLILHQALCHISRFPSVKRGILPEPVDLSNKQGQIPRPDHIAGDMQLH